MTCNDCRLDVFRCRCNGDHSVDCYSREEIEAALAGRLTPEFVDTLLWLARVYGWTGDYWEVQAFLAWVYSLNTGSLSEGHVFAAKVEPLVFSR